MLKIAIETKQSRDGDYNGKKTSLFQFDISSNFDDEMGLLLLFILGAFGAN